MRANQFSLPRRASLSALISFFSVLVTANKWDKGVNSGQVKTTRAVHTNNIEVGETGKVKRESFHRVDCFNRLR